MTDTSGPPEGPTPGGRARRAGRLGRKIALGVYLVAVAYMAVVGFHSVISQVFWPEHVASAQEAPAGVSCSDLARGLTQSLLDYASNHLRAGGESIRSHDDFFDSWDRRHLEARARCEGSRAIEAVHSLRYRIETNLRRFDREERRLVRRAMGDAR